MKIISFFEKHLSEIVLVMVTVLIIIGFFICWSPALSWWGKSLMVLSVALIECLVVYLLTRSVLNRYRTNKHYDYDLNRLATTHIFCCILLAIIPGVITVDVAWFIPNIVLVIIAFFAGGVIIGIADEVITGHR